MLFDTHMHCNMSCDSHMQYEDAMRVAKEQGIGMIVTEHWDYDYPTNPEEFLFDLDEYMRIAKKFRSDDVLFGIEIGMQRQTAKRDEKVAASVGFDYVLASIHCMGGRDIYEPTCYTGFTRQEIIDEYLADAIYCLKAHDNFDSFAHIDYICRYWPYEGDERELHLEDNPQGFDELFKLLIAKNKPIEINTRRLDDEKAYAGLVPLYARYKELGGKFVTIGSDAHYEEHVGRRIDLAVKMAKDLGLVPIYFKNRKQMEVDN
ncbi:MAG: PHP domain-containing protein [Phascolarctobacterium sp.]|nr:PHP domain-containing protein [Phascolarctobacterium sp.]